MSKAVLIINLGSPESPSPKDVKTYLNEFLMDKYVIDIAYPLRALLVKGIILNTRPKESAKAYKKVWTEEGSPLITTSMETRKKLEETLNIPVFCAMRYGNPSIKNTLETIHNEHPKITDLCVIYMYPHYAESSFRTAQDCFEKELKRQKSTLKIHTIPPFYKHPDYIAALADTIRPYTEKPYDHLLVSYHGLPERHLTKIDPTKSHCLKTPDCCSKPSKAWDTCYKHHTVETTKALISELNLPEEKVSIAYQSRLGKDPWITPATDDELVRLAKSGVKNLIVTCPAFVADCLETLEEIEMEGRNEFLEAGGETFQYIPCLNTTQQWITCLAQWARCSLELTTPEAKIA